MKRFIFLFSLFFAIGLSLSVKSETIMQNKDVVVVSNKKYVKYDKNCYNTIALQKEHNGYCIKVYDKVKTPEFDIIKFPDSFKLPFLKGEIWICDESTRIIYVTNKLLAYVNKKTDLEFMDERANIARYNVYRREALALQKQRSLLKIPRVANTDEEKRKKQELEDIDKKKRAEIIEILNKVKKECGDEYYSALRKELNMELKKLKESR